MAPLLRTLAGAGAVGVAARRAAPPHADRLGIERLGVGRCRCRSRSARGDPIEFTADEGIRADTTTESLSGLRPAFRKGGTITAGSASQMSDGACAVVVMNKAKAEELGLD